MDDQIRGRRILRVDVDLLGLVIVTECQHQVVSRSRRLLDSEPDPATRSSSVARRCVGSRRSHVDNLGFVDARPIVVACASLALSVEPATAATTTVTDWAARRAIIDGGTFDAGTTCGVADLRVELIAVCGARAARADVQPDVTDRRHRRAAIGRARRHHTRVAHARETLGTGSLRVADADRRAVGGIEAADLRIWFGTGNESNDTPTPRAHDAIVPKRSDRWNGEHERRLRPAREGVAAFLCPDHAGFAGGPFWRTLVS